MKKIILLISLLSMVLFFWFKEKKEVLEQNVSYESFLVKSPSSITCKGMDSKSEEKTGLNYSLNITEKDVVYCYVGKKPVILFNEKDYVRGVSDVNELEILSLEEKKAYFIGKIAAVHPTPSLESSIVNDWSGKIKVVLEKEESEDCLFCEKGKNIDTIFTYYETFPQSEALSYGLWLNEDFFNACGRTNGYLKKFEYSKTIKEVLRGKEKEIAGCKQKPLYEQDYCYYQAYLRLLPLESLNYNKCWEQKEVIKAHNKNYILNQSKPFGLVFFHKAIPLSSKSVSVVISRSEELSYENDKGNIVNCKIESIQSTISKSLNSKKRHVLMESFSFSEDECHKNIDGKRFQVFKNMYFFEKI